jgi:hypothetical protein
MPPSRAATLSNPCCFIISAELALVCSAGQEQ